jgi:hypothetical protein
MKTNRVVLPSLILIGPLLFITISGQTQNAADLSSFLGASKQDASSLISAYVSPAIKAVSYGMTGGWYHTAKTHKKLGIDLGVTMNVVFVPNSDNYFQPYSVLGPNTTTQFVNNSYPSSQNAPTIFGPKESTSYTATYKPSGYPQQTVSIPGPQGLDLKGSIGFSAVPVPMAQIGIGLIKNTDLKIRFLPQISSGGTTLSMLGFGLLHDIKQYFPGIKLLPFDLSVLAGYNTFKGNTSLVSNGVSYRPDSPDGKVTYNLNSWVAQILISKKVSVLTFYAGVGYGAVSTKVNVTGTYTIVAVPAGSFQVTNPVSFSLNNTGAKLTGGMRLKFGPLYFNGDYTLQKYNSVSVGLGLSIR